MELFGTRIAVDWGKARIGVAACDPRGILAYPVETVATRDRPIARLVEIIAEYEPVEIIMGLPVALDGTERIAARDVRRAGQRLAEAVAPIPVRYVDERMTTRTAARALHEAGRDARHQRSVIDQAAAVAILEHVLEQARTSGAEGDRR
ncbi:MAG: Holliday junction resolvase RuvX [Acidipropionibacterium acidipropionici]|jgi:putative Holliday junction resolvase|uniref:Putative pre-16S rRNA nuclease n=2 Tax=Acidipropionibacterium acidipropionici TaxID=1748 RepID=A0A142KEC7_9ACTN|nr:Holliday junction resolvase RuvX [Acidipropionibacterium acidipropionici]AFV89583.1 Putative Holliday junction resolvase [Acidipropionibacterium acidipropionici ATCC 4875]ALN15971.1 Holliday junction resolvase [Acidipropionibacterium acidipropionici]AMS04465.1 Holliday junction resolvase [Acidipropionibacterium acidipropionici]AOZ45958.1 Holliday junction resolvase [Acidipropionibacterium acidipropionici]APZ08281.1 Holliday junction resolvase RuvX [Acidipropionibacterium acidipropionici]